MSATIEANGERVRLTDAEWELLRDSIVRDTLRFWDEVSRDVDAGLVPPELAGAGATVDRATLFSLREKLAAIGAA